MPSKNNIPTFKILIDSRESKPYTFQSIKPEPPAIKVVGLKTGDYSLEGFEKSGICCERKTAIDLFGSVGKGRKRLEAEFQRMSEFDYSAIIIESSLSNIFMNPPARSHMSSKAVFRTLVSWSVKYNVCVWDMWNREASEKLCYLLLKNYYNNWLARNGGKLK